LPPRGDALRAVQSSGGTAARAGRNTDQKLHASSAKYSMSFFLRSGPGLSL
jgi:hypothetical protein